MLCPFGVHLAIETRETQPMFRLLASKFEAQWRAWLKTAGLAVAIEEHRITDPFKQRRLVAWPEEMPCAWRRFPYCCSIQHVMHRPTDAP